MYINWKFPKYLRKQIYKEHFLEELRRSSDSVKLQASINSLFLYGVVEQHILLKQGEENHCVSWNFFSSKDHWPIYILNQCATYFENRSKTHEAKMQPEKISSIRLWNNWVANCVATEAMGQRFFLYIYGYNKTSCDQVFLMFSFNQHRWVSYKH